NPVAAEAPAGIVPPLYGTAWRALFAFVGLALLFIAGVLVLSGEWASILMAAAAACMGVTMGYFAVTGRRPAGSLPYTPSRRFAELADPARPLAPEDLCLPSVESTPANPPGGPARPGDSGTMLERLP
ncbi:MAG TPA: hypothetical protein VLR69_21655, partial [Thermoanaerobaculia bacterium]|nr:hypothetical protein [Thermoanaerobaculia bacterium]